MKTILSIFAVFAMTSIASAQTESPKRIEVPPIQAQQSPSYFKDGNGIVFVSLNGGAKWEKVGATILKDTEFNNASNLLMITPNPIQANGTVSLNLEATSPVEIVLMTVQGAHITTIASGTFEAGKRSWNVDASRISSGVYICSVSIAGKVSRSLLTIHK